MKPFAAEAARAGFMVACARLLQMNGFLAMDRKGNTWSKGLDVFPTSAALDEIKEPALAQAWKQIVAEETDR